ncbi:aldehyde ferredoxin oxidoreductase family protein [Aminivibrio sp.]|uniref:aldehyde ferredoxin oxidoreductase family protein n=1 Tax=Aminivibrio sp. TaxID=1872489 RepID=UPI001A5895A6|nr:aldehyde ferredoxin oxidoreductase family protein [Aminivibrio sp.]MBL3539594.1 aldehyde ferredoxin oxidoreductase family protein [Aminivibrio sp.]MDK2958477.1 aldehyde:ferredoxin oxidoreductase [Synergistaceae bacterium]
MEMKVALVHLTSRTMEDLIVPGTVVRKFIGGSGLGTWLLFRYGSPAADPLSPDNPLIFMNGPFQGTGIPTSGRHQVISKSPLTDAFGESDCGGAFGFHLKKAGYDGIVFLGKASSPVYVAVIDGRVEIRNGTSLWGKDTFETEEALLAAEGKPAGVACIGPAGERMVLLANIMHDGRNARAAGRGGMGAVMGSKNLKAVVARGNGRTVMADEKRVREKSAEKAKFYMEKHLAMTRFGTAGGVALAEQNGDLPLKNWSLGSWPEEVKSITGEAMAETILTGNWGCVACPIRCGREVAFDDIHGAGPEYETIGMLGSNCLINDLKAIGRGNDLCNRMGIDTISGGSAVAFSMELYERGIIDEKTVGYPLHWGDGEAMLKLLGDISEKRGFGAVLAEGTRKAAKKIGKGAEKYAIHSKGMDFPAHDPRCYKSLAAGYATSNRGACHLSGFSYSFERSMTYPELGVDTILDRTVDEGKGRINVGFQNLMGVMDSLKMCKFPFAATRIDDLLEWISGVTGWNMDAGELMTAGERIFNLKKLFNLACGLTAGDDTLPERILREPRGSGGSADTLPDLEKQLREYYAERGWTEEGIPLPEKINSLGLEEFFPRKD